MVCGNSQSCGVLLTYNAHNGYLGIYEGGKVCVQGFFWFPKIWSPLKRKRLRSLCGTYAGPLLVETPCRFRAKFFGEGALPVVGAWGI